MLFPPRSFLEKIGILEILSFSTKEEIKKLKIIKKML
jgi:hypothetical protein